MRAIWRHVRGWPRPGQIGIAMLLGVLVAVAATAATDGRGKARTGARPTLPSGSVVPASTTSAASTASRPTTTTLRAVAATTGATAPPTTRRVPPPTAPPTTKPAPRLLPLVIAAPSHADSYNRDADFGGFDDVDGCKNTRAVLLIRTSHAPVTFTTARDCTVKTGLWTDPWSGVSTTVAHDLEIDHTVPLANAWRSGAWAWTHAQRVAYVNDLVDADHLVPILSAENEAKGDDGPDAWKPPNPAAWCRYALAWDHVASKWHLSVTQAEWSAITVMAATC